jgi:hypothetical protein
MAVSGMLFAALSALTLIYTVRHLDPPAPESLDRQDRKQEIPEAIAV